MICGYFLKNQMAKFHAEFQNLLQFDLTVSIFSHVFIVKSTNIDYIFSERVYVVVRQSIVCSLSVVFLTFVRPTQATEIFGNVSTPFGTLAIHDLSLKILRR